ncbi:hypothetical protein NB689_001528 [Xanthomonas sacchari]|nr:hypothetical protein [Xanthomonas sacchari]
MPPHHLAPQHDLRRLRRSGLNDIAIERSRLDVASLIAQGQFDPLRIQIQRVHHLRHQQRHIGPADQFALTLCRGRRRRGAAIHRQQQQERLRPLRAGLHQRDRPGQARFSAQRRRQGRAAPRRLRGDIQTQRGGVIAHRLDVLDDEAITAVRRQLPDAEVRTTQCPLGGDEALLVGLRDATDEAEATRARKLAAYVTALAVAQHLLAMQRIAGSDDHAAHTAQAMVIVGQSLFDTGEDGACLAIQLRLHMPRIGPLQLQGHDRGDRHADQQGRQRPVQRTALERQRGHGHAPPWSAVSMDRVMHPWSQRQWPAWRAWRASGAA